MTRTLCSALAVCLLLAGCGGQTTNLTRPQPDGQQHKSGIGATLLRSASGAPAGVEVSWEAVPGVAGYNLYRDSAAIPDDLSTHQSLKVNVSPIPATPATGTVVYDDLFSTTVGDVWHYRVTSLDSSGDESDPSPESTLTISDFVVTKLVDTTGGVGDTVEIDGLNFGSYDAANDHVYFPGVTFDPTDGFVPGPIEATILEHEINRIRCTVPQGATSGKLTVTQEGLSQDTPETFTNTDPYITSIDPIVGVSTDEVVVTGNNFGTTHDLNHRLFYGGQPIADSNYTAYGIIEIRFHAPTSNGYGNPLSVEVHVNTKSSNQGKFTLNDQPPVAALAATPQTGGTPLVVNLVADASNDPDGDTLFYSWDFDGDGTIDFDSGTTSSVSHSYDLHGDYDPVVYVSDGFGGSDTATTSVHVDLSPLVLDDNGSFAPTAEFFQSDGVVPISYKLSGGEPSYTIKWYLVNPVTLKQYELATDSNVVYGAGVRDFPIDTTAQPEDGADSIPAGQWQIVGIASDGNVVNDPDPQRTWPSYANGNPGSFFVYRYNTVVVQDTEGDPNGAESPKLAQALTKLGYKVSTKSSTGLTLADLLGSQSVIWSADGPHGSPGKPYEWLSAADLSLAKDYLNNRGALIILGPPASSTDTPFPQDLDFNDNYQSFDATTQVSPPGRLNLDSFTAGDPNGYSITLASMGAVFGGTEKVTAPPAYSLDLEASFPDATGGTSFAAVCTRPNPAGNWATYIGQFTLSGITGLEPAGATKDQLLDNIVAGTIAFQNGS